MTPTTETANPHNPENELDRSPMTSSTSPLVDHQSQDQPQRVVHLLGQDLSQPQPLPSPTLEQPPQPLSSACSCPDQQSEPMEPDPVAPQLEPRPRGRPQTEVSAEEHEEIVKLHAFYGTRRIAERVGLSRHLVTRVLEQQGLLEAQPAPSTSKLEPFRQAIESRVKKGLTTKRIHREVAALGYDGGRTILAECVQELRLKVTGEAKSQVKRRFETAPGEELQIDWSPYVIPIAGRWVQVRALGCLLGFSRKLYLRFYRNERQSTLLEGLASAFVYFDGVTQRVVLDNMSTAVLGHIGSDRKPLWHPRFLDFARHYGFEPFACRIRDPDRKGKQEKSFRLVWDDFLKGSEFSSWEDLDERRGLWLDHTADVGNQRLHGTTRRIPNEAWLEEQPLLIRLPEAQFSVHEESARMVDRDATLSIHGTRYTVPSVLANRSVAVRLYAEHFEVLDPNGRVAFSRAYVSDAQKGQLIIDRTHYANLSRRPTGGAARAGERLDDAFIRRFPELAPFVDGLKVRMKSLAPVHLRSLLRLSDQYGQEALVAATSRAQHYRRFDANAVQRILEQNHSPVDGHQLPPLGGAGPNILGEVEPPSFDGFSDFDHAACPRTPPADSTAATDSAAATNSESTAATDSKEGSHGSPS
jgi:transposase